MEWVEIETPYGIVYGTYAGTFQFIRSLEEGGKYLLTAKRVPNLGPRLELGEFDSIEEIEDVINTFVSFRGH